VTTTPDLPLVDATAMTRFHRIFREALDAAPRLVGEVADGDHARADHVGGYYANILALLHAHHEAEDATLWPLMLERLPEHADLINRGSAEHEAVVARLEATEEALASWCADPSDGARAALLTALAGLGELLIEHLDHEEADVVPLIGQSISVAEWGAMSADAFQRFSGDKPWLVIGLIQEQMLATENAGMEANMPPPARDFWVGTGRPMFEQYVGALRA
jgi:hemerythrin-like domain-containing protein